MGRTGKRKAWHDFDLPPNRLNLDDVELLKDIVQAASGNVEISSGKYTYPTVDDLKTSGAKVLKELLITGSSPRIYVRLRKAGAQLTLFDAEKIPVAHLASILDFFDRPGWKFKKALLSGWVMAALIVLSVAIMVFGEYLSNALGIGIGYFVAAIVIIFVLEGWQLWSRYGRYSQVYLRRGAEERSFWTRNGDTIVVALITSALTAAGTLITQQLLGWIWVSP